MKKLLFILFAFAFTQLLAQAPDPDFIEKMAAGEQLNYLKLATFTESDDLADYDLVYQRLDFTVDPAVRWIVGDVQSKVIFLRDQVAQIRFDLTDSLVVDSVSCNGAKVSFTHAGNKITVELSQIMSRNDVAEFEVFYHGAPPSSGFGSFAVEKHNNVPVMWTLSEPYGAMEWWPCKQSLADKIDSIDVFVHCPPQYKAASNGKLISDLSVENIRTAHWQHRYPIATYLVAFAVTNYEELKDYLTLDSEEKIEVLNYVYPEYLETAKTKTKDILDILQFYNSRFVQYPFSKEKYGHAQFGWGGGMEHQTMSFMNNLGFELVAHEMAHQWFGDYITLASWHDIWLNEGFATYLTGLSFENLQDGIWWPVWKSNVIRQVTRLPEGSVYVADTTNISRIFDSRLTYSKGALLLHMLRWELGDQRFFRGMRDYLNDPEVAYGFASQQKFVGHMEVAGDTTLTEFFADWYYGEGYPVYQLSLFADGEKTKLRIDQTQTHSSVSFFEMDVPVRVWINGNYKDLRLHSTGQGQDFVIAESAVDSVQFDPEMWLCARLGGITKMQEIVGSDPFSLVTDLSGKRIRIESSGFNKEAKLRIFDLSGRIIFSGKLTKSGEWLDLGRFSGTLCLIEIRDGGLQKTWKFLPGISGKSRSFTD